uniref:RNA-directed DNA polymerase from mobile element jockey n=1 Tax=Schizaphis graminum TaxID=13262 RepID=A0A2S2NK85_SCHGA
MSKVFERIILSRLKYLINIRNEQHAFRTGHSTTTQLITLIDDLTSKTQEGEKTVAVFLDVAKAFDRVWHQGLIYKLMTTNVPLPLIKLVDSFLKNRSFQIKIDDHLSTPRKINAGVPQGSCLSTLLYLVYTNDFPTLRPTTASLFANDTLLYTSNRNYKYAVLALQRQLIITSEWFSKWRIQLNISKIGGIK